LLRRAIEADRIQSLIFFGPPGTGKTLIAKALAHSTNCNFIIVNGPELVSMWAGESERGIRESADVAKAIALGANMVMIDVIITGFGALQALSDVSSVSTRARSTGSSDPTAPARRPSRPHGLTRSSSSRSSLRTR
jgi:DNA polymerase III delta prime subunit